VNPALGNGRLDAVLINAGYGLMGALSNLEFGLSF
jgi:hypothetical protein